MRAEHASSVYVENDGSQYGRTIAQELQQSAKSAGLSVVASPASAQAVFYGGNVQSPASRAAAAHAVDQAAASAPRAHLYVPSGLYDPAFVAELSSAARARLFASSPGLLTPDLPAAGKTFISAFRTAYGHAPAPQAIFGYEAMAAVLATLTQAGAAANQRATVVKGFRSLKRPNSVLGSYTISGGDPSVAPFILARVRGGQLVPFKSLSAAG
jgi:branched-chain amino acid transport system substrate-binding protein